MPGQLRIRVRHATIIGPGLILFGFIHRETKQSVETAKIETQAENYAI
jgi:hypothetical protein